MESLLSFDVAAFWLINGSHSPVFDFLLGALTHLGNGWVITPILVATVVIQRPKGRLVRVIAAGALALSVSGIVNTQIIKPAVKRPRPLKYFALHPDDVPVVLATNGECAGAGCVHAPGEKLRNRSFPSGHTNSAFAAASALIVLYGGWAWLAVIPAFLVGYSRIYLGVHFPLDVLVGGALGVSVAWGTMTAARRWWLAEPREADFSGSASGQGEPS